MHSRRLFLRTAAAGAGGVLLHGLPWGEEAQPAPPDLPTDPRELERYLFAYGMERDPVMAHAISGSQQWLRAIDRNGLSQENLTGLIRSTRLMGIQTRVGGYDRTLQETFGKAIEESGRGAVISQLVASQTARPPQFITDLGLGELPSEPALSSQEWGEWLDAARPISSSMLRTAESLSEFYNDVGRSLPISGGQVGYPGAFVLQAQMERCRRLDQSCRRAHDRVRNTHSNWKGAASAFAVAAALAAGCAAAGLICAPALAGFAVAAGTLAAIAAGAYVQYRTAVDDRDRICNMAGRCHRDGG